MPSIIFAQVHAPNCGRPSSRPPSWGASKALSACGPQRVPKAQPHLEKLDERSGSVPLSLAASSSEATSTTPPPTATGDYVIRSATSADVEATSRMLHGAFRDFYASVGRKGPIPLELAEMVTRKKTGQPGIDQIVAVSVDDRGRELEVIGVNGIDLRDDIVGIGIVAAKPHSGCSGVGRALMNRAIEICEGDGRETMALTVEGLNPRAFALYASLGFEVVEPIAAVTGQVSDEAAAAALTWAEGERVEIRSMGPGDAAGCANLFRRSFGVGREMGIAGALGDWPMAGLGLVAVTQRGGGEQVVGYTTVPCIAGHYLAENEQILEALAASGSAMMAKEDAMDFEMMVLSESNPALLRWALGAGLVVKQHMMFMTRGKSIERAPGVAYCPDGFY